MVDELKRALESHTRRTEGSKKARLRFRVCTYEEDFELEETVQEAMRETIRNCSSLLVVSSKSSAQSSHVRFELQTFRDLHGADRLLAAQLDLLPELAFPDVFAGGALAANLEPSLGMTPRELRLQLLRESHKVVAKVWDIPLAEVHDRFEQQRKRQARIVVGWSSLAVTLTLALVTWYNSDVGFHQLRVYPGEEPRNNSILAGFVGTSDDEFVTFHQDHLHRWAVKDLRNAGRTELQGFTHQAALITPDTAVIAQGKQLHRYRLGSGEKLELFTAPGFIDGMAVADGRWVVVSQGRLFVGNMAGEVREAPRPEVTVGRNFPEEFRSRGTLRYGEKPIFCDGGRWLATASFTGQLVVLNPETWEWLDPANVVVHEAADTRPLSGLACDPASRRLFFFEGARSMRALSFDSRAVGQLTMPEIGVVTHAAFVSGGEYFAAATDKAVHWFRREGERYAHLGSSDGDPFQVTGLLISPSGRLIVAGGYQDHAKMFRRTLRVFGIDVPLP